MIPLIAAGDSISMTILLTLLTTFGAVFVVLSKMVDYLIAEIRRKREEKAIREGDTVELTHKGSGCVECQARVKNVLELIRGDLKVAQNERIADLKEWAKMSRKDSHLARNAVSEFSKVVRESMGIELVGMEEKGTEEGGDDDED